MIEVFVLFVIGLVYLIFASIEDLRTTVVYDWLNYSLVIFVLGFRLIYSVFSDDFSFFYLGLVGFILFYILGILMYYGRFFAGADAKMFGAIGALIPWNLDFFSNVNLFFIFIIFFLLAGAVYGLFWIFFLVYKNWNNFKKSFKIIYKKNFSLFLVSFIFCFIVFFLGFFYIYFFLFGVLFFFIIFLYLVSKSIDGSLVCEVFSKELIEGDWLYEKVKVGKKFILPSWDGLTKEDIALLVKNKKKVKIKKGIAFLPSFLIAYILFWIWRFL